MSWNDLLLRLRALRSRERAESELDDELKFHLEMEARKLAERGLSERAARTAARAGFGGVEQVREECRDARGVSVLENLARDVRYGLRMLAKTPVFTAVAILSLAIGIGANTAVFTLIDALLLKSLPVRHPEQLVALKWGTKHDIDINTSYSTNGPDARGRHVTNVISWRIYQELRTNSRTLESVIGFSQLWKASVAAHGQALVTDGMVVTGNYFSALGVSPAAGRLLTSDDDTESGVPALVISYQLWETLYGREPEAIGKTLFVNGQPCAIVGVAPREILGISPAKRFGVAVAIRQRDRLAGAAKSRTDWFSDDFFWMQTIGRRHAGVSDEAIEAEVGAKIATNLPEPSRSKLAGETPYVAAEPARQGISSIREYYRRPLLILMTVVALMLLMACANLAGLLLARANGRGREILIRIALGAKRGRLVRQLLVEGALLSAAGAAAGLLVAYEGLRALLAVMAGPGSTLEAPLDGRVLAFTAAVSMATTLLFALAPALRATRVDVAAGLKEETPSAGSPRFAAVRTLVAVQIAVAVPLVAGGLLFGRTLVNLRSTEFGFNTGNLVLFDLRPEQSGYDEARSAQLYARVLERLRQTSGVVGATLSGTRPLSGFASNGWVRIEGKPKRSQCYYQFVGPDYAEVMQLPLVAGRGLRERDMSGPGTALVNETFARQNFGGESPLGRRFRWTAKDPQSLEIVGVVKDAKYDTVRGEVPATVYSPFTNTPWGWRSQITIEVRTAGSTPAAVAAIQRSMGEIDRRLPLIELLTQRAQVDELLTQERLFAWLVALFGAMTVALACVGLYGMVAASVASRTREIGVRMALGADRGSVLRIVFGQVAATAAVGLAVGLGATWAATRVVKATLYGVTEHDPATLAMAEAAVLGLALLAAAWPARRATRIDPVQALRYE
jgi:macrolide transport system ATP-binding/permease protein